MRATNILQFQSTPVTNLLRPWKKFKDGTIFYGLTKTGNKRTPLTTKQGNKTMYKGTRSSGIGRHTKYGEYVINWRKVRTFVTPTFPNLELKPLVSHNTNELRHEFTGFKKGPLDKNLYFEKIKEFIRDGRVQGKASDVSCHAERG
ncbi:mitochondrial 54S ribosomal protein mL41 NDAI_0B04890 [Naumovozyma dairenensis CBS 421]|uniref:54S ribosomal protein L27, mitochondrial n=1 Tax=Naumovozyma dairenensis (strain ATCC 10597 / BCRC 20456 / CBS 421 / NBRC 0211 / NRRL Y-12639) TaxID=1071378 RepID=G0W6W2_NAUDC|nr:hypothetical protein NDAI_0B04890 [Naumovozyma dairenensis CBS 421]CCD23523.1 hypothetical protein NDAI_0B04890 [Naumovozyma dairenensis CBS 421]